MSDHLELGLQVPVIYHIGDRIEPGPLVHLKRKQAGEQKMWLVWNQYRKSWRGVRYSRKNGLIYKALNTMRFLCFRSISKVHCLIFFLNLFICAHECGGHTTTFGSQFSLSREYWSLNSGLQIWCPALDSLSCFLARFRILKGSFGMPLCHQWPHKLSWTLCTS